MCPTLLGRLQTRIAILALPAFLAALWGLVTRDPTWLVFVGIWLLVGCAADVAVYRPLVRWQPRWLGLAMAAFEWVIVTGAAQLVDLGPGEVRMTLVYWAAWLVAQGVRIAVLPVVFVTRLEEGGELGRTRWWIPEGQEMLTAQPGSGEPLPDRLSAVWSATSDGPPLAAPSQMAPIPAEFLAALRASKERGG